MKTNHITHSEFDAAYHQERLLGFVPVLVDGDYEYGSFTYKGHLYPYPLVDSSECSVGSFTLSAGDHKVESAVGKEYLLYLNPSQTRSLKLSTSPRFWGFAQPKESEMSLFLFKEGDPMPIDKCSCSPNRDGVADFLFSWGDRQPVSGNYFIYIPRADVMKENKDLYYSNQHVVLIPFTLIVDDPSRLRVKLAKVQAVLGNRKDQEGAVSSGKLNLNLTLWNLPSSKCTVGMYLYNEMYALVDENEKVLSAGKGGTREVRFTVDSHRLWQESVYRAVITFNRTPFAMAELTCLPTGVMESSVKVLDKDTPLCWMVQELEGTSSTHQWKNSGRFPGVGSERLHIARLHRQWSRLAEEGKRRGVEVITIGGERALYANRIGLCWTPLFLKGRKAKHNYLCNKPCDVALDSYRTDNSYDVQVFHYASQLLNPDWSDFMDILVERLQAADLPTTYVFCDSEEALKILYKRYPIIRERCADDHSFHISPDTPVEITDMLLERFRTYMLVPSEDRTDRMEDTLFRRIAELTDDYGLRYWTSDEMDVYAQAVRDRAVQRSPRPVDDGQVVSVKTDDLVDLLKFLHDHPVKNAGKSRGFSSDRQAFDESMKELNRMIGLHSLKTGLRTTLTQVLFNKLRTSKGLPSACSAPHHMLFVGNPGTGKTTVAKLIGKIYKSLGLLSNGEVIVTERTKLVGPYIGHTEENMRKVLEEARGKVLFIDEAYTLCESLEDRKDFGGKVVESLLTVLAEPNPDMLVILAGYEKEMDRLMEKNQGLRSRFAYKYRFDDYDGGELYQIACRELERYLYELSPEADASLRRLCDRMVAHKDRAFANGRWIMQVVGNGILPAMARRVMDLPDPDDLDLLTIVKPEDVEAAALAYGPLEKKVRRIGFCA